LPEEKVFCPNCGCENSLSAGFCSGCGAKLVKPELPRMVFCANCGMQSELSKGACPGCGAKLADSKPNAKKVAKAEISAEKTEKSGAKAEKSAESAGNSISGAEISAKDTAKAKKKHMIVGICAVAAVLIAVAVALVLILGGNDGRTYFKTPEEAVTAFMEAGSRGDAEAMNEMIFHGVEGSYYYGLLHSVESEEDSGVYLYDENEPLRKIRAGIERYFALEEFEYSIDFCEFLDQACENPDEAEDALRYYNEIYCLSLPACRVENVAAITVVISGLDSEGGAVDFSMPFMVLKLDDGWVVTMPEEFWY